VLLLRRVQQLERLQVHANVGAEFTGPKILLPSIKCHLVSPYSYSYSSLSPYPITKLIGYQSCISKLNENLFSQYPD
jgi:hypothetical protein